VQSFLKRKYTKTEEEKKREKKEKKKKKTESKIQTRDKENGRTWFVLIGKLSSSDIGRKQQQQQQ